MGSSIYFSQNLKLDASSDTLIMKNDKTFEYFKYYNDVFPSRNFLVLAIESENIIDSKYIVARAFKKLPEIYQTLNKIQKELNS